MATLTEVGGWRAVLASLVDGADLDEEVARSAVAEILAGEATPAQIAGFLTALQTKGTAPSELAAMVDAMLEAALPLHLDRVDDVVDIVGTGGSRLRQDKAFNISTTACFVVAGADVPVCKHGNRRASSSSGSSDALEALGVAVEIDGPAVARCVAEAGVGFAFARTFHPAMRHAGPVRAELGIPTVFNILGPLSHPGGVRRQVIGVADEGLAPLVIDVLRRRGAPRAMVVHGSDGLDELTLTGPSTVYELRDGEIAETQVLPQHLGLVAAVVEDVGVGSPEDNATAIRAVLSGESGARRDVVLLNAAAGLVVGGAADDLEVGLELAARSVDSGRAMAALEKVVEISNEAMDGA
jgi:anthranilate phosphoribosyltransferase